MIETIVAHLEQTQLIQDQVAQKGLGEQLNALQTWQTERLLTTHHSLWDNKRFRPAMQFFIDELYGPKDFSQRDAELAQVVPKMAKLLPEKALKSLEAALRLNSLSLQLDLRLLKALGDRPLNADSYFDSYRLAGTLIERDEQIQLLESLGSDLADVVKISGISTILMLSKKPAKALGVESLHEFLDSGFRAFKKLKRVEDFINPIVETERALMHQLFDAKTIDQNPLPRFL